MIVPCWFARHFDGFGDSDFVGDAVMTDFELDMLDGVAKEFVSVFYIVLTDEYGVLGTVNEFDL